MLLALGVVLTTGCGTKGTPMNVKGVPAPTGTRPTDEGPATNPEIKTTAEAFAKEVLADEKAAESKYKGKVVELEGQVQYANKIIGNDRMITLVGAKKKPTDVVGLNIACVPAAEGKDKMWWLGRGEKVKVIGRVSPYMSTSSVTLEQCTITEVGKNPTPQVTAEALVEEFVKDEGAAKKKYTESEFVMKEVIVEGTVAGTESKPDGSFHLVDLAGKNGYTVRCTVPKDVKDSLKKGDRVTMKGDLSLFDKDKKQLTVNTAFLLKKD